jgi:hypothetical protein
MGGYIIDCSSLTRGCVSLRRIAGLLALATALAAPTPAAAIAAPTPKPIAIHVRDLAHYKLWYVRLVDHAVQYQVNHQLHRLWHTPLISFDAPSTQAALGDRWQVDVLPTTTVMYGYFNVANGFHMPGPPVNIEIAGLTKNMPMSLILSHEIIEALVDPAGTRTTQGVLTEVCDPVQQPGYRINGITVANFVTPRWFIKSAVAGRFDYDRLLTKPQSITPQGFLPGGMG